MKTPLVISPWNQVMQKTKKNKKLVSLPETNIIVPEN